MNEIKNATKNKNKNKKHFMKKKTKHYLFLPYT